MENKILKSIGKVALDFIIAAAGNYVGCALWDLTFKGIQKLKKNKHNQEKEETKNS
jgi:hypothetical protein